MSLTKPLPTTKPTLKPAQQTTNKHSLTDALAIFGGSFDPIHYGHIIPVTYAANKLGIKQVTLMPAYQSPHKQGTFASSEQRLAMLELLCQQHPLFTIETRELANHNPSYTIDSLQALKQQNPKRKLLFFIGLDALLSFTTWHKYHEILKICHLVVCTRPNYHLNKLNAATNALLSTHQVNQITQLDQQNAGAIYLVACPENIEQNISSMQIREYLKTKKNCQPLMPAVIEEYIRKNQLYINT